MDLQEIDIQNDLVTGIIAGLVSTALFSVITYFALSSAGSPFTHADLNVGTPFSNGEAVQITVENDGKEPLENLGIHISSPDVDYDRTHHINLSKTDEEEIIFDGLKTDTINVSGGSSITYNVKDFERAEEVCNTSNKNNNRIQVSSDTIEVTYTDITKQKTTSATYQVEFEHPKESQSTAFEYPIGGTSQTTDTYQENISITPILAPRDGDCELNPGYQGAFRLSNFEDDPVKKLYPR